MTDANVLGFIGLGVMGEAMCRNLVKKSGARIGAYDTRPGPLDALAADGVERAASVADVSARAGTICRWGQVSRSAQTWRPEKAFMSPTLSVMLDRTTISG
jgi:UDP-N-acetylmuramoylalanine-D-glutamate ligase